MNLFNEIYFIAANVVICKENDRDTDNGENKD